ncbi:MAG: IreB family regulatory phosphoprotein [Bacilli bacterium]
MEKTRFYTYKDFDEKLVKETLKDVYNILKDRGYNPVNQLVGYIMSGDPGFITSHKEARQKISRLERNKIIEILLNDYMAK